MDFVDEEKYTEKSSKIVLEWIWIIRHTQWHRAMIVDMKHEVDQVHVNNSKFNGDIKINVLKYWNAEALFWKLH